MYDYLIVGAGLYGAVCARELTDVGKKCLVIDRRPHIAGNVYTEKTEGINVHVYGAHIFHTNNKEVWDYVNRFAVFNRFTNSPVANYKGELFSKLYPYHHHTLQLPDPNSLIPIIHFPSSIVPGLANIPFRVVTRL